MPSKDTPHDPTRIPKCSQLPPEIWINIFSFYPRNTSSLTHLWSTCRRVSSTFRACAEHAFGAYFLNEIHIVFHLDKHYLGGRLADRPKVAVAFDRVGAGASKEKAWFSDRSPIPSVPPNGAHISHAKRMQRWEEHVLKSKPELPYYTIRVNHMVNDTELPGLSVDIEKREICFEWRKALKLFFREEAHREVLWERWKAEGSRYAITLREVLEGRIAAEGESPPSPDREPNGGRAWFNMRRDTRRKRLREAYAGDALMQWAIESLKEFPTGTAKGANLLPDLPGAGIGEKWFGRVNVVQELYLDEMSCLERIEERLHREGEGDDAYTQDYIRMCSR